MRLPTPSVVFPKGFSINMWQSCLAASSAIGMCELVGVAIKEI